MLAATQVLMYFWMDTCKEHETGRNISCQIILQLQHTVTDSKIRYLLFDFLFGDLQNTLEPFILHHSVTIKTMGTQKIFFSSLASIIQLDTSSK